MKSLKNYFVLGICLVFLLGILSCTNTNKNQEETNSVEIDSMPKPQKTQNEAKAEIPKGYVLFEKISGDLNGDGEDDDVLIVKATKKEAIVQDENQGKLDRNRRGILIFFNTNEQSKLITQKLDCFSSENEDGGVYFPPELSIEIKNGKLYVHYSHGRYGFWKYTFRYNKKSDFELIGYDNSESLGPIVNTETSINFLTKRKLIKENVNEQAEESGDEVFEEKWENIANKPLVLLSEIEDFDTLNF